MASDNAIIPASGYRAPQDDKAPPLAFKRPLPPVRGRTKIERYNLEEYAWKLFFNFSKDAKDIALLCNTELQNRIAHLRQAGKLPPGWSHDHIRTADATKFIHQMQMQIDYAEGERLHRIYKSTLDTVRQLQLVLTEITDWRRAWEDVIKDYFSQHRHGEAAELYKLVQKDRAQVMQLNKVLSEIKTKVKTHVQIDWLKLHVRNLIGVVESSSMDDVSKDMLLEEFGEVLESAKIDYDEDTDG